MSRRKYWGQSIQSQSKLVRGQTWCKNRSPLRRRFELLEDRALLTTSSLVFPGADGHLVYVPNAAGDVIPNFSMVGYMTGDVPLPDTTGGVAVPVMATVNPGAAGVDMTTTIQNAINAVSAMPLQSNGFRGAVLLAAGNYPISGSLTISASGVVLEGAGNDATTGTRLEATGTDTRVLITISGSGSRSTVANTTHNVTDSYVPVGATSFNVDSTANLHVGDTIIVERPSNQAWIDAIGANTLTDPWTPGSKNLDSDRVITAINGNTITIDAPLTNSLANTTDEPYGGGTIFRYTWSGRISNVGLENLYTYSDSVGITDAAHSNGVLTLNTAINSWVNNVTGNGFASNGIEINSGAKWITMNNITIENTSQTAANNSAPPAGIGNQGQEVLIENSTFHSAYHFIAVGPSVPGPSVYYNITSDGKEAEAGPHQRWSTGGLFDNVTTHNTISDRNAGNEGTGHGWQGANYVYWNVTSATTKIYDPPTAQNWVIGGSTTSKNGDAIYDQFGITVTPQSLYIAQLMDRFTPTVATAAAAAPGTVTGKTTTLTALGADVAGEANLIYTWATTSAPAGAAPPTYSSGNGTNAGKSVTATFTHAGAYTFQVTITYPGGFSVTSSVNVTVSQTATSVALTPSSLSIKGGGTQQFVLSNIDQFGNSMGAAQSATWSVTGGGSITTSGLYTAPAAAGTATITATSGVSRSSTVTITNAAPTVAIAAKGTPNPIQGTTAVLNVLGADDPGDYYNAVVSSAPQAWYQLNETVGTVATNSGVGGSALNGTYSGVTLNQTSAFPQLGASAAFNGTSSLVDLGNPAALNFSGAITLEAWVKPTAADMATSGEFDIVAHGYTRNPSDEDFLRINGGTSPMYAIGSWNGTTVAASLAIPAGDIGNWVYLVGEYDPNYGGAGQGAWALYRNGVLAAVSSVTSQGALTVAADWVIGAGGNTTDRRYFNGGIDEVAIYNSVLSPAQIAAHYAAGQQGIATGAGESNLTYTWTTIGTPPAAVNFSANGTNAAKNTTVTFSAAGTYNFQVTITDAGGLTTTSSTSVTVNQTLTSIAVLPTAVNLNSGQTDLFSATALDQFGNPVSAQPSITWSLDGGSVGSVSTAGLYTAPLSPVGSATVRASNGTLSGTATVTVSYLKGDVNIDGHVDVTDVFALMHALVDMGTYQSSHSLADQDVLALADIDGDKVVTNADLQSLLNLLLSGSGSASSEAASGSPPSSSADSAVSVNVAASDEQAAVCASVSSVASPSGAFVSVSSVPVVLPPVSSEPAEPVSEAVVVAELITSTAALVSQEPPLTDVKTTDHQSPLNVPALEPGALFWVQTIARQSLNSVSSDVADDRAAIAISSAAYENYTANHSAVSTATARTTIADDHIFSDASELELLLDDAVWANIPDGS